ncbi:MAG: hypothetical protein HY822_07230 [Acidobacteria bacterium]|nr:hypothetical protein [Acidobacteriota bacterium]
MKRIVLALLAAGLPAVLWLARPSGPRSVAAAAPPKAAFLVRFGLDGRPDIDWSGSLAAPGARLSAWQFDPKTDQLDGAAWKCATRGQTYWDTPYERLMGPTSRRDKVTGKGIVVELAAPVPARVSTRQGDFTFESNLTPGDAPRLFLDGRASVQALPAATWITRDADAEDFPSLLETRDGTLWMAYQSYDGKGDRVYVRRAGSDPEPVSEAGIDCYRTALAQDRAGRVWVVWSAQVNNNFDLYARAFDGKGWSRIERLTSAENPDIFHTLAADAAGHLYLAWQSARSGNFDIYLRVFDGAKWGPEIQVSSDAAHDWEPALAIAPGGAVTIVWDTYSKGNYDVVARTWQNGRLGALTQIAASGAFETRASAQYDRQGRLWLAWDEGDWNWGKDYGYQIPESGRGLLVRRQVRVAVLENGRLSETAAPISGAVPEDLRQVFQHPNLALDANGNPWVFFRTRVNLPQGEGRGAFRALWRLCGTTYRGGRWSPMMEFPEGFGRIDMAAATALRRNGDIALAWASDGRVWPAGRPLDQDLRLATIPSGPAGAAPKLAAFAPSTENLPPAHPAEAADIARVRAYRSSGLRVVRGDIHRHTDLSWDGNRDGSLDDSYRYAMDAAGFDFLGVCDHQAGESIAYNWWRIQKAADLYTIRGRFAPVYSYERSLSWPNGHRNVVFALRGRPVLEIPEAEARGQEGAARLYAYLRRFAGVTTSHTSASGMGTDWRDSDPELEPVVELYQGYRSNFETPGAPRAPTRKESSKFAAGFVWNAWAKGIKMGVQSSSDHVSTHISYAGFYVDRVDRGAIVEAMKARHSYAATDNLFVDLRMGEHFMGDAFSAATPPPLTAFVSGTGPLKQVEVIRSNRIVYTAPGAGREMRFTYTDREPPASEVWYYVRAEQQDGQLCWSSPIWVRYP